MKATCVQTAPSPSTKHQAPGTGSCAAACSETGEEPPEALTGVEQRPCIR